MSSFDPYANIDSVLDGIEKDFSLTHSTLDRTEKRTSTGLLSLDLVLGGGIIPGGWYTLFGHEQTCKSTLASTILANSLNSTVPIVQIWDYEGSVSSDYVENIMKSCGIHGKVEDLFGVKDLDGKWVVKPRARYYAESILEKFFDNMAKLQRVLPDKVKIGGQWFLIYDETKENLKHLSGKYDAGYHKSAGKLKVPAEDNGDMQALLIVDSYPSMMPARQDVDELGGAFAVAARAFSEQLKRVKGRMRNKRMTVVGINQLRDKPGVTYGCLYGDTLIPFVDGSYHTIQEIVENKIQGEVWSVNEVSGKIESKKIVGWHYNGEEKVAGNWIMIVSRLGELSLDSKLCSVTVTLDHKILTNVGWVKAKDLTLTHTVVAMYERDSYTQKEHSEFVPIIDIVYYKEEEDPSKTFSKYDISVEDNHNYIAGSVKNGIIVSNSPQYEPAGTALKMFSDVRLQLTSRSIPHGKGQLEEEDSVTTPGAKDIYRYIHVRAVKNKLSAPYLETWLRLWVTDGTDARGFDPVWDCWQYGLTTGQLKGSRNNIKLHLVDKSTGEERVAKKGIKWTDFKTLILGDKAQVAAIFKSVGLKPVWLRKFFKTQLEEGLGTTLYFNHKIASGKVKGSESGESDSYDSDSSEPQIHEV